jgi:hypothetical protein
MREGQIALWGCNVRLRAALVLFPDVHDLRDFAVALERLATIEARNGGKAAYRATTWLGASRRVGGEGYLRCGSTSPVY